MEIIVGVEAYVSVFHVRVSCVLTRAWYVFNAYLFMFVCVCACLVRV